MSSSTAGGGDLKLRCRLEDLHRRHRWEEPDHHEQVTTVAAFSTSSDDTAATVVPDLDRHRRLEDPCTDIAANAAVPSSPPAAAAKMGISSDSMHKRRATGGKKKSWRKKRKYELGRQPANTKLSSNKTVRRVCVRGGNVKWRALRLDTGNFSWGSEATIRKARIIEVVYNASNNELVRTKTLVKGAIVQVDAAPFKQWYLQHYGVEIGRKKKSATSTAKKDTTEDVEAATEEVKKSKHVIRKLEKRQKDRELDSHIEE